MLKGVNYVRWQWYWKGMLIVQALCRYLSRIALSSVQFILLKVVWHEIFDFKLFHESVSPGPLSNPVRPFRIFSKIRWNISNNNYFFIQSLSVRNRKNGIPLFYFIFLAHFKQFTMKIYFPLSLFFIQSLLSNTSVSSLRSLDSFSVFNFCKIGIDWWDMMSCALENLQKIFFTDTFY
jgi:hypothetical protein